MGTFRFLLALSVVAWHMSGEASYLLPGTLAVQIFFAISGFYMALILDGKYSSARTFYLNRFLRLYPAYFVIMTATLLMQRSGVLTFVGAAAYDGLPTWAKVGVTASNWTLIGIDIPTFLVRDGFRLLTVDTAWSIGSEIWFYLLAPFLVRLRSLVLTAILIASVVTTLPVEQLGYESYRFFPAQLCFIVSGTIAYRIYSGPACGFFDHLPRWIGISALLCTWSLIAFAYRIPQTKLPYVAYVCLIFAIPFLFAFTRKSAIDLKIGNLSYSIYLLHPVVAAVLQQHFPAEAGVISLAAITIIISIAIYLVVEMPVDSIRQRIAAKPTLN